MSDQEPPPEPHWSAPGGGPPIGEPQQVGPQPPYPPYPPYASYPPPFVRPEAPGATTALVLGIVGLAGGLAVCGLPLVVCPFAWYYGNQALREIENSGGALGGHSQARAGQVMGIIGTAILALAVVVLVVVLIAAGASSN